MNKDLKVEYSDGFISDDFTRGYRIIVPMVSKSYFKTILDYLCDHIGECNLIDNWKYQLTGVYRLHENKVTKKIFILFRYRKDIEDFCEFFHFDKTIDYRSNTEKRIQEVINKFLFGPYTWESFYKIRELLAVRMNIKTTLIHKTETGLFIDMPNGKGYELFLTI